MTIVTIDVKPDRETGTATCVSKEQAADNRQRLLYAASRLLREDGIRREWQALDKHQPLTKGHAGPSGVDFRKCPKADTDCR
jgi:hypothetical protein